MVHIRSILLAAVCATVLSVGVGLSSGANAASCGNFLVDPGTCLEPGVVGGNPGASTFLPYVLIDKSDNDPEDPDGAVPFSLTMLPSGTTGKSGTWSIDPILLSVYSSFILTLKAGNEYAAFLLSTLSGTWASARHDLSHASLYGLVGPNPAIGTTPIPAPFFLMGTVLVGTYLVGRWRRRRGQASTSSAA